MVMKIRLFIPVVVLFLIFAPVVFAQKIKGSDPPQIPEGVELIRDIIYAKVGEIPLMLDIYFPKGTKDPLPHRPEAYRRVGHVIRRAPHSDVGDIGGREGSRGGSRKPGAVEPRAGRVRFLWSDGPHSDLR